MNFTVTWILDKCGFVPKSSIDFQEFPFPKPKTPAKKVAKKVAKKTTTRKPKK